MNRRFIVLRNGGLVVAAVGLAFVVSLLADRFIPRVYPIPAKPKYVNLNTPPNSVFHYKTVDFECTIRTNSLGLRGRDVPMEKGDAFRIAVIGSSYVYGWGVNDDACWVSLLERHLRAQGLNVEVLNLGNNGASPPQYAKLAEETVPMLRPDLILVVLGQGCDLAWTAPMSLLVRVERLLKRLYPNIMALRAAANASTIPWHPPKDVPETDEDIAAAHTAGQEAMRKLAASMQAGWSEERRLRYEKLDPAVKDLFCAGRISPGVINLATQSPDLYAQPVNLTDPDMRSRVEWLTDYLRRIRDCGRQCGAGALALSIPFGAYVNKPANENCRRIGFSVYPETLTSSAPDDVLREASEKAGIPFFSATDAFRAQSDNPRLFFQYDLHLAAEGQVLYANTIAPWIAEHVAMARENSPAS